MTVLMKSKERIGEAEFLQNYDITKYDRPSYTADVLAVKENQILLIQRGNHPYKDYWALVGGFVEMSEDIVEAAKRELQEETGLTALNLAELATYGTPGRDPRGRIISTVYIAQVQGQVLADDDAKNAQWFDITMGDEDDILTIQLSYESEILRIVAKIEQNPLSGKRFCATLFESDLAFDHGRIVADGLLALRRWNDGETKFNIGERLLSTNNGERLF